MEMRTVEQPRISGEVRFLSWNVLAWGLEAHANDIITALKTFDCDVLMLFELNNIVRLREKICDMGYWDVYVKMNYRSQLLRPMEGGMGIFSRFPIVDTRIVPRLHDGIFC